MKSRKPGEIYMMVCAGFSALIWLVGLLKLNFLWFVPDTMSLTGAIFVLVIFGFHLIGTFGLLCAPVFWFQEQVKSRQQSHKESRDE